MEKKKGTEYAPRLFDLTSLQVECNKKFSLSADDTLKIIQSLYEKHVTTYPRVDTTYLSDDIYPKVPATLQGIKDYFPQVTPLLPLKADGKKGAGSLPKSKKVFDNKKVTDHHAIIPTGQRPDNLSELERKGFKQAILQRFDDYRREHKPPYWFAMSIGYSRHVPGQTLEALIEQADHALYQEKQRTNAGR